jgi:hypothetical protein
VNEVDHDRNQTMGQSRMDMDILFPETKYFYLTNSSICAEKLLEVVMSLVEFVISIISNLVLSCWYHDGVN